MKMWKLSDTDVCDSGLRLTMTMSHLMACGHSLNCSREDTEMSFFNSSDRRLDEEEAGNTLIHLHFLSNGLSNLHFHPESFVVYDSDSRRMRVIVMNSLKYFGFILL